MAKRNRKFGIKGLNSIPYDISIYFNDQPYSEKICIERHWGDEYKVWLSVNEGNKSIKEGFNEFEYDISGNPYFVVLISHKLMSVSSITNKIKYLVTKYRSLLKQSGY